jgi:hypothetical protein
LFNTVEVGLVEKTFLFNQTTLRFRLGESAFVFPAPDNLTSPPPLSSSTQAMIKRTMKMQRNRQRRLGLIVMIVAPHSKADLKMRVFQNAAYCPVLFIKYLLAKMTQTVFGLLGIVSPTAG